jgi:SPOR domain
LGTKMATRFRFNRLALDANESQTNSRDVDVLPVPTLDERVNLYLRAVHGIRDFTEEERSNVRSVLLDSMAAEIAAQVIPAEQSPEGDLPGRETTYGADRASFLAQYSLPEESAQRQEWAIEPEITELRPLHPYEAAAQHWPSVQRKETIRVAPIARRRTSILALTATLGLVLIVTGGTLGYRWTHPHIGEEVSEPSQQDRVPPPTTSPRSLSTPPAPSEQHVVQIASQRSEADVLAVFRRLQQEQPTLVGQATLKRIDLGQQSYTAQVGPFASEKDAAAVCRALEAADFRCFSPMTKTP